MDNLTQIQYPKDIALFGVTMIKNIVFDLGNVLFGYDPVYILNQLLPENKFHDEYLTHFIHSQLWQDLDRGSIEESALIDLLVNKINDPNLDGTADIQKGILIARKLLLGV